MFQAARFVSVISAALWLHPPQMGDSPSVGTVPFFIWAAGWSILVLPLGQMLRVCFQAVRHMVGDEQVLHPAPVALGHCFKRGGFSASLASGKMPQFWLHLWLAAIYLSFYCVHWKAPAWREILLGMSKPVPCPSHLCSSISQSPLSVRYNTAAVVPENTTILRLQNDWDLGPNPSSNTPLGKMPSLSYANFCWFFFFPPLLSSCHLFRSWIILNGQNSPVYFIGN